MIELNYERNSRIAKRRKAGVAWRKIASEFDISPERCRQIYLSYLRKYDRQAWKKWEAGLAERSRKRQIALEKKQKEYDVLVRYFDREENADDIARDAGWSKEKMDKVIIRARADRWVTETEYKQRMQELESKYGKLR